MQSILIGTKNPHKREKLSAMVCDHFTPCYAESLTEPEETAGSFLAIAEEKAVAYSKQSGGLTIATDGGASFPGLKVWDPLKTKRFAEGTDEERIVALLEMLSDVQDRTVEWREAIALADNGKLLFSAEARSMDGQIATEFNSKFYRPGIWLCSVTHFPQFNNRNFFELNDEEQRQTENSWSELERLLRAFLSNSNRLDIASDSTQ